MVHLSLLDEIKDKAARLIPTAYMEIVEECTAPHLLIPTYEHVKFLSETVNRKPDTLVDVARALRRRISDADVAVKHLTVQLIELIVKNATTPFHIELASQKGLLRDLVAVACLQPTTGRAMQAKEAALLLTLNLSIWFRAHPAEECYILTTLADDVRNQLGPNCFEGLEPERSTRLRVQVDPRTQPHRSRDDNASRSRPHRHDKRNVVDAIPVDYPTPERISAMLDVCMAFSEYVNNAEMNTGGSLRGDEVVQSYLSQVRKDHNFVALLLSSNLQLDRDVLRTISDSQSAVLTKVRRGLAARPSQTAIQPTPQTPPVALLSTQVRSAEDTEQPHTKQHADPLLFTASTHAEPSLAEVPSGPAAAEQPSGSSNNASAAVAAPSMDDLFADVHADVAAAGAPVPGPSQAVDEAAPAPAAAPPAAAPSPTATGNAREEAEAKAQEASQPAATAAEGAPAEPAAEAPKEEVHAEESEPTVSSAAAALDAVLAAEPTPAPPGAAPLAGAPPKDDDDFDAFLEGHLGS